MRKMVLLNLQGAVSGADEGTGDELHDIETAARTSVADISRFQSALESDTAPSKEGQTDETDRAMDLLIMA